MAHVCFFPFFWPDLLLIVVIFRYRGTWRWDREERISCRGAWSRDGGGDEEGQEGFGPAGDYESREGRKFTKAATTWS